MMYTIARYYSTPEHMTRLFIKLTNQVRSRSKTGESVGRHGLYSRGRMSTLAVGHAGHLIRLLAVLLSLL